MNENGTVQAYVRLRSKTNPDKWFAHPELRQRLVADAKERGGNMTEVAVRILCEALDYEYEPNGRSTDPKTDDTFITITIPQALKSRLKQRYDAYQDGIRELLCLHYGLEPAVKALRNDAAAAA